MTDDDNAPSFKHKVNFEIIRNAIINCKIELSLKWIENCILTINPNANNNINKATFTITDAKRYIPIVTLKTEDNAKLSKLLREGLFIGLFIRINTKQFQLK